MPVLAAQELKPEQAVALVSCLVWREKSEAGGRVSADMEGPVGALRQAARHVAKVTTAARPRPLAAYTCTSPACRDHGRQYWLKGTWSPCPTRG